MTEQQRHIYFSKTDSLRSGASGASCVVDSEYGVDVKYCILNLRIAVNKNKMVFGSYRKKKTNISPTGRVCFLAGRRTPKGPPSVMNKKSPRLSEGFFLESSAVPHVIKKGPRRALFPFSRMR